MQNIPGNSGIAGLFSDETIRIAVGTIDESANITYAANTFGQANHNYIVIMDYIKYMSMPMAARVEDSGKTRTINNIQLISPGSTSFNPPDRNQVVMPLYVGIGLRLTANLRVFSGKVNLGNFFGLGASGSLTNTTGTLTVQTLGITGDGISALIPMPGDLNTTTIQNAIQSLGAIKAKMYEQQTILSPRVVGFYNNVGGISTIIANKVISNILSQTIVVPYYSR